MGQPLIEDLYKGNNLKKRKKDIELPAVDLTGVPAGVMTLARTARVRAGNACGTCLTGFTGGLCTGLAGNRTGAAARGLKAGAFARRFTGIRARIITGIMAWTCLTGVNASRDQRYTVITIRSRFTV